MMFYPAVTIQATLRPASPIRVVSYSTENRWQYRLYTSPRDQILLFCLAYCVCYWRRGTLVAGRQYSSNVQGLLYTSFLCQQLRTDRYSPPSLVIILAASLSTFRRVSWEAIWCRTAISKTKSNIPSLRQRRRQSMWRASSTAAMVLHLSTPTQNTSFLTCFLYSPLPHPKSITKSPSLKSSLRYAAISGMTLLWKSNPKPLQASWTYSCSMRAGVRPSSCCRCILERYLVRSGLCFFMVAWSYPWESQQKKQGHWHGVHLILRKVSEILLERCLIYPSTRSILRHAIPCVQAYRASPEKMATDRAGRYTLLSCPSNLLKSMTSPDSRLTEMKTSSKGECVSK